MVGFNSGVNAHALQKYGCLEQKQYYKSSVTCRSTESKYQVTKSISIVIPSQ